MSNFFQNTQNHGLWNFDFWFLSREKEATVIYCFILIEVHQYEKMK